MFLQLKGRPFILPVEYMLIPDLIDYEKYLLDLNKKTNNTRRAERKQPMHSMEFAVLSNIDAGY